MAAAGAAPERYDVAVGFKVALAVVACFVLAAPRAVRAEVPALSFDQIGRVLTDATPPPPDSFARDAAAIASLPPMPKGPPGGGGTASGLGLLAAVPVIGIFAGIAEQMATMAYVKSLQAYNAQMTALGKAYMNAGTIEHHAFLQGWSRVDMTRMSLAVIQKPDRGETTYLDLAHRTYRIARSAPAPSGDTYVVSDSDNASPPSIDANSNTKSLEHRMLSGLPADGYRTTASFETTSSVGWCKPGAHQLEETEYDTSSPDPQNANAPPMTVAQIVNEACAPTSTSAHDAPGRLYLFRTTILTNTVNGTLTFVSERGNITRAPVASSLFDIPSGYTEEKTP